MAPPKAANGASPSSTTSPSKTGEVPTTHNPPTDGTEEPILRLSRNIIVRQWHASDAASFFKHANNPNVRRNMAARFRLPFIEFDATNWIEEVLDPAGWAPAGKGKLVDPNDPNDYNNDTSMTDTSRDPGTGTTELSWTHLPRLPTRYAIATLPTNAAIGAIAIRFGEDDKQRTANFGFWLAEEHWGKGIVTEVATAFMHWCWITFDDFLQCLTAGALESNHGSRRVLEKIGFAYVGRIEESLWREGRMVGDDVFCMTRKRYDEVVRGKSQQILWSV